MDSDQQGSFQKSWSEKRSYDWSLQKDIRFLGHIISKEGLECVCHYKVASKRKEWDDDDDVHPIWTKLKKSEEQFLAVLPIVQSGNTRMAKCASCIAPNHVIPNCWNKTI